MESITAFVEGPLCFVIMCGIYKQSSWRYTLQIMVSCGQLYGDLVYYGTAYLEGEALPVLYGLPKKLLGQTMYHAIPSATQLWQLLLDRTFLQTRRWPWGR